MRQLVVAFRTGQAGQSMVEYAIVLFLVAVVAMVAVRLLGQGVDEVFRSILASFRSVLPAGGGGS
jgi:Flp pilus assembly pilin Flp